MHAVQVSPRLPTYRLSQILRLFSCAGGKRRYSTPLDHECYNSALTDSSRSVMVDSLAVANAAKVGTL